MSSPSYNLKSMGQGEDKGVANLSITSTIYSRLMDKGPHVSHKRVYVEAHQLLKYVDDKCRERQRSAYKESPNFEWHEMKVAADGRPVYSLGESGTSMDKAIRMLERSHKTVMVDLTESHADVSVMFKSDNREQEKTAGAHLQEPVAYVCRDQWERLISSLRGLDLGLQKQQETLAKDVHKGIECKGCVAGKKAESGMECRDIRGPRFRCTSCPDFDLCAECEGKGYSTAQHAPWHTMLKIKCPQHKWWSDMDTHVHTGVVCDSCNPDEILVVDTETSSEEGFIRGRRYRCLKCPGFDLCHRCYTTGKSIGGHDASHPMTCIKRSRGLIPGIRELTFSLDAYCELIPMFGDSVRDLRTKLEDYDALRRRYDSLLASSRKTPPAPVAPAVDMSAIDVRGIRISGDGVDFYLHFGITNNNPEPLPEQFALIIHSDNASVLINCPLTSRKLPSASSRLFSFRCIPQLLNTNYTLSLVPPLGPPFFSCPFTLAAIPQCFLSIPSVASEYSNLSDDSYDLLTDSEIEVL